MLSIEKQNALRAALTRILQQFNDAERGEVYNITKHVLDDLNIANADGTMTLAADLIDTLAEHPNALVCVEGEPFGAIIVEQGQPECVSIHSISADEEILSANFIEPETSAPHPASTVPCARCERLVQVAREEGTDEGTAAFIAAATCTHQNGAAI